MLELQEVEISGDLELESHHVGHEILDPESQFCVTSPIDPVLLQLLAERLFPIHPAKILLFRLILKSKVGYLKERETGVHHGFPELMMRNSLTPDIFQPILTYV